MPTPNPLAPSPLAGRTALISGGSRGIGLEIAKAIARAGASVALLAKTGEPDPRLPGTIHTAAAEIEALGAPALPIVGDVRRAEDVTRAVAATAERFGGIDLLVNNASAILLSPIGDLQARRFDLMLDVNVRGTFLLTREALPHLRKSPHAHVLTLSPPLTSDARWLRGHAPYTLTKMGMTMLTLGLAADEARDQVAANCLWPRTLIATAAVQNLLGGDDAVARSRTPQIMGDAARIILERDPASCSGHAFIDDDVVGATAADLDQYRVVPEGELELDLLVDSWGDRRGSPAAAG